MLTSLALNISNGDIIMSETLNDTHQYLIFGLQDDTFALDILRIKEIIEYNNVTKVPMVPSFIRGVMNLRGNVVPVIDLSVRFGWQRAAISKRTCIVILEVAQADCQLDVGIMVDIVNEVIEIPPQHISPAPAFGAKIRTDFIAGMGETDKGFLIILNTDHVLSIDELTTLTNMTEQALDRHSVSDAVAVPA